MKDALGHGSDTRGAHAVGVDQLGRSPLSPPKWFHGSPTGVPGPKGPVHVGTESAARIALEARIGVPADGKGWDGTREYGKTLLAGQDTLDRLQASGTYVNKYPQSGYNSGSSREDVPKHDYYPTERQERAKFGDGTPVPFEAKPAVAAYSIVGAMKNDTGRPYSDTRANAMSKRQGMKNGYYYKNDGEDTGSISAVVPSAAALRRIG
jgi:hypothetical protein